ncbi:MAG: ABC transporter substrate-binding protein, partial [Synergistales bacterium]|nr:ABC transporter substrate-binding protein [Synergistales bacterium]
MERWNNWRALGVVLGIFIIAAITVGCGQGTTQTGREEQPKVNEIKIGTILPLTGFAAEHGKDEQQGVDFAIEKINARANETRIKLVAVHEDSAGLPKNAVSAMQKLVQADKVPVVLIGF